MNEDIFDSKRKSFIEIGELFFGQLQSTNGKSYYCKMSTKMLLLVLWNILQMQEKLMYTPLL